MRGTPRGGAWLVGDWLVEPWLQRISGKDTVHHLEPRVMRVLVCLARRPGELLTRAELLRDAWGDAGGDEEALARTVRDLRVLLGDDAAQPRYIETIRASGYRLVAPVVPAPPGTPSPRLFEYSGDGADPVVVLRARRAAERRARPVWLVPLLLQVAGVVVVLGIVLFRRTPPPPPPLLPVTAVTSRAGVAVDPALSPGGLYVAYARAASDTAGAFDLYVQDPAGTPRRLTDLPGRSRAPAWSPDGATLAFAHDGPGGAALYTVPAAGGPARKLLDTPAPVQGLDWSPDGATLVFSVARDSTRTAVLSVLELATRAVRALTTAEVPGTPGDVAPAFSPNGRMVAFARWQSMLESDVYLVPAEGGPLRRVATVPSAVRGLDWTADGQSLVLSSQHGGTAGLWRLPLAGGRLAWVPLAVPHAVQPSVQGRRLVFAEGWEAHALWRAVPGGAPRPLAGAAGWEGEPRFSPDGRRLAFTSSRSGSRELWVAAADGSTPARLTALGRPYVGRPHWSPDGERLAFSAMEPDGSAVFVVEVAGGQPVRLTDHNWQARAAGWSHDGEWIYFSTFRERRWQLWKVSAGGGLPHQVLSDGGLHAAEAPDGQWIYYTHPGAAGLWKRPLHRPGQPERVVEGVQDRDGGNWLVAGGGLYFVRRPSGAARVFFYDFATGVARPVADVPEIARDGLAVSPDGRTILFARRGTSGSDLRLVDGI